MKLARVLMVVATLAVLPGCAAIAKFLPAVIAAVDDAAQILDIIDTAAGAYFASRPEDPKRAEYERAVIKARMALSAASRATKGAEHLTQEQADAAFEEFRRAYQDLLAVVGPLGIAAPGGGFGVAPGGGVTVPEPLAFSLGAPQ
jgi:hypothetical protein